MILLGLAGMRFDCDGVRFCPCVPDGISSVEIENVKYRNMYLNITVRGTGTKIKSCTINGKNPGTAFVGVAQTGRQDVVIALR